jgi:hypothetical protein
VVYVSSERQYGGANEDELIEGLNGERSGIDQQVARHLRDTSSAQLEDQYERARRSDAPTPEERLAEGTSDISCKSPVSESDADVHTAPVRVPALNALHIDARESHTVRAGEAVRGAVLTEAENIDGITIAIHLRGQDDLVLDVELKGVARRG